MSESKQRRPRNEIGRHWAIESRPESTFACDKDSATFVKGPLGSIAESHSVPFPQSAQTQSESFCPEQAEVDAYLDHLEHELQENAALLQRQTSRESKQIATKTGSSSFLAVLIYVVVLTICGLGYLIYILYEAMSM